MPYLGVTHLTGRQSYVPAGSDQFAMSVALPQRVKHGGIRELDGVPRSGRSDAPAVQDHQDDGLRHEVAAAAMASRLSGSSEAPPTSAPSMSGCDSSSAAFSGLTEPP